MTALPELRRPRALLPTRFLTAFPRPSAPLRSCRLAFRFLRLKLALSLRHVVPRAGRGGATCRRAGTPHDVTGYSGPFRPQWTQSDTLRGTAIQEFKGKLCYHFQGSGHLCIIKCDGLCFLYIKVQIRLGVRQAKWKIKGVPKNFSSHWGDGPGGEGACRPVKSLWFNPGGGHSLNQSEN